MIIFNLYFPKLKSKCYLQTFNSNNVALWYVEKCIIKPNFKAKYQNWHRTVNLSSPWINWRNFSVTLLNWNVRKPSDPVFICIVLLLNSFWWAIFKKTWPGVFWYRGWGLAIKSSQRWKLFAFFNKRGTFPCFFFENKNNALSVFAQNLMHIYTQSERERERRSEIWMIAIKHDSWTMCLIYISVIINSKKKKKSF